MNIYYNVVDNVIFLMSWHPTTLHKNKFLIFVESPLYNEGYDILLVDKPYFNTVLEDLIYIGEL